MAFGEGPLSHPLVVDAALEFVPEAVFNNVKGPDQDVLKRFGEPACNNPVVRFANAAGKDLIPRKDGVYSTAALLARMVGALKAAGREPPEYLRTAAWEFNPSARNTACFAMG